MYESFVDGHESEQQIALHEALLPKDEKLQLAEAIEFAKNGYVTCYKVEDTDSINGVIHELLQGGAHFEADKYGYGDAEYPDVGELSDLAVDRLWREFAGDESGYMAASGAINIYKPGYGFMIHQDLGGWQSGHGEPAEALTFLYVIEGSKDLVFYDDRQGSNELLRVTQRPGELYVFQGGNYTFPDGTAAQALWHGVPAQEVSNKTITWELMPRSRSQATSTS